MASSRGEESTVSCPFAPRDVKRDRAPGVPLDSAQLGAALASRAFWFVYRAGTAVDVIERRYPLARVPKRRVVTF